MRQAKTPVDDLPDSWGALLEQAINVVREGDHRNWRLGDMAVAVQNGAKYGDHTLEQFADAIDIEFGTLKNYARVARAFELSHRCDNLSWTHHAAVASMPDRDAWLKKAARPPVWSVAKLRREAHPPLDETALHYLPLESIVANPAQPRTHYNEDALIELTESIIQNGVVQPIVVRPMGDGTYQIVCGHRRWIAAQRAGLTEMPARVMTLDDETALVLAITENVNRRDMDEIDGARAYATLIELNKTPAEVAEIFGRTPKQIADSLALLGLVDEAQGEVARGAISKKVGVQLSRLKPDQQQATLVRIQANEFEGDNEKLFRHIDLILMDENQAKAVFEAVVGDDSPETMSRRRAERRKIESAWAKVETMAALIEPMLIRGDKEITPADLAFALGQDCEIYVVKLNMLMAAAGHLRDNMKQAAALMAESQHNGHKPVPVKRTHKNGTQPADGWP